MVRKYQNTIQNPYEPAPAPPPSRPPPPPPRHARHPPTPPPPPPRPPPPPPPRPPPPPPAEPLRPPLAGVRNPVQRHPRVPTDCRVKRAIHPQLLRMDVDLHELRLRRKQPRAAQRQPVVDPLANHQEEVRLAKNRVHRVVQRRIRVPHGEGIIVRHRAARHGDRVERNLRAIHKFPQRPLRAAPPHPAPGDRHRPLRRAQQLRRPRYIGATRGRVPLPAAKRRLRRTAREHIHRYRQMQCPAPTRIRLHVRPLQVERNLSRRRHSRRPLHHRTRHPHLT